MKRPFYGLGSVYFAALFVASLVPLWVTLILAVVCLLCFGLTWVVNKGKDATAFRVMLAAACIALCAFTVKEQIGILPLLEQSGTEKTITAKVIDLTEESFRATLEVQDGELPPHTKLYADGASWDPRPHPGTLVSLTVALSSTENASETNYFSFAKSQGIYLYGRAKGEVQVVGQAQPTVSDTLARIQKTVRASFLSQFPAGEGAVASAVCLGNKDSLSDEEIRAFRKSGVSHILVVSGLHVSALVWSLYMVLRRLLRLPNAVAVPFSLLVLVAFCAFVGGSASVIRAAILQAVILIGTCFRRQSDSRNSLGLALLLLALWDPYAVYDLGLWLSFGATWGIVVLYPPLRGVLLRKFALHKRRNPWQSLAEKLLSSVCVTLAAELPLLPLLAYAYRELSWIAPFTNILCVYPALVLLWSGWLSLLLCTVWAPLGVVFQAMTRILERYLVSMTSCLGKNWAVFSLRQPYLWVVLLICLLLCILGYYYRGQRGQRVAAWGAVALCTTTVLVYTLAMRGVTVLTAFPTARGMAVLLEREGHCAAMVSGGPETWNTIEFALEQRGIDSVDTILVTDSDALEAGQWDRCRRQVSADTYILPLELGRKVGNREDSSLRFLSYYTSPRQVCFWNDSAIKACGRGIWELTLGQTVILCGGQEHFLPSEALDSSADLILWNGSIPLTARWNAEVWQFGKTKAGKGTQGQNGSIPVLAMNKTRSIATR